MVLRGTRPDEDRALSELVEQQAVGINPPKPTKGIVARAVAWKGLSILVSQACWYGSLLVLARLVPPERLRGGCCRRGNYQSGHHAARLGCRGSLIIARELDAKSDAEQ
jgi:hypothetical protein